jgi:ribosomal protein S12 methylthiotransferase accessory factor
MTDAIQLEALRGLISPKTGILRRVERRVVSADEPPIPILYDGQLSNFDFKSTETIERGSCGKNITETAAQIGAIGEAVEHYCASHANIQNLRRGPIASIPDAVAPPEFVLFSEAQYSSPGFRFSRWTPESDMGWLPARELPTMKRVWVPASMVYLTYSGDQPQDMLCPPTSSGSAAGRDLDNAILRGLMETMERDAFMNTWLARLSVPRIDYSGLDGPCGVIRDHYARYGVDVQAYLLATDLPVYAVMAIGLQKDGDGPAAVVGLGCHLDPKAALCGALFEVCQVRPAESVKHAKGEAAKLNSYSDIHSLEEHAAYFTRPDHLHELDFLTSGKRVLRIEDLADRATGSAQSDLSFVVDALNAIGSRALFADITTPDLEDYPIRVVRALATHLQPIGFGHDMQRLGGARLYELPVKLGYASRTLTAVDLNPCPHPLA